MRRRVVCLMMSESEILKVHGKSCNSQRLDWSVGYPGSSMETVKSLAPRAVSRGNQSVR